MVVEYGKVPGAMGTFWFVDPTLAGAEDAATSACNSYVNSHNGSAYAPEDCNSITWVQYGWMAFDDANPNATDYIWSAGTGWGPTKAIAENNAVSNCRQLGGNDCSNTLQEDVTGGYTGTGTTGGVVLNALQKAVKWDQDHKGWSQWNGYCEKAVEAAYYGAFTYGSASLNYTAQLQAGRIHMDTHPPAGALVFFKGGTAPIDQCTGSPGGLCGHVGIAVGDGAKFWTSDGTIHPAPYSEGLGYEGWSFAP